MPVLTQISTDDPRLMEEEKVVSNTIGDLVATTDAGRIDRTVAGPFPSTHMLLYQTLTADNDMQFKIAPDSVSFILVSGLIDQTTDVTALFGESMEGTLP